MSALDRAIAGLDEVQRRKIAAAKQRTVDVNRFATEVAQRENWTTPNGETSRGRVRIAADKTSPRDAITRARGGATQRPTAAGTRVATTPRPRPRI